MTSVQTGNRLRALRQAQGLSQPALARKVMAMEREGVKITGAYVSRLESGERRASVRVLEALADALGTTRGYLEEGALWWTVVGIYPGVTTEDDQRYCEYVKAPDATQAELKAFKKAGVAEDTLLIAGTFPGRLTPAA